MNQSKKPRKEQFKQWFAEKSDQFFQYSRHIQVLWASLCSLVFLIIAVLLIPSNSGATFSALAVLFVSSPVAFVVWRFRDENQSKDINLKEFQKISEWVTGAHFQEEKHSEKFSGSQNHQANMLLISERSGELYPLNDQSKLPSERSREYYRPAASAQALHSFSKQDGAVGLQIAAVYNLLPFYRGDYGQAFEKPSVHLLHSAWKVLQHDILQELNKTDDDKMQEALIKQLHQRADSPLGQAITRVLLACDYADKPLLHRHSEIFPGICLSGMDFGLIGVETEILRSTLFCKQDLNMAQLHGIRRIDKGNLEKLELNGVNLSGAELNEANLSGAKLKEANLSGAELNGANLSGAELNGANLSGAKLKKANLSSVKLWNAKLVKATLTDIKNLSGAEFYQADLSEVKADGADLSGAWFKQAKLTNANLEYSKLRGTRLEGADLSGVNFFKADLLNAELNHADLSKARLLKVNLSGAQFCNTKLAEAQLKANLFNVESLTVEQILATKILAGSLIDADNFSQYTQRQQQYLQEQGLIVLHSGSDAVAHTLFCKHKIGNNWSSEYSDEQIPFSIDLAATQAANLDWNITIEKDKINQPPIMVGFPIANRTT